MKTQFVITTEWPSGDLSSARLARELEIAINRHRRRHGLGELPSDPGLTAASRTHAERMRDIGFFAHFDPVNGSGPLERLEAIGRSGWSRIAENLAAGQWTVEQVLEGWLASPGHRANLEDADMALVGTAITLGGPLNTYVVQLYGATAVIENGTVVA